MFVQIWQAREKKKESLLKSNTFMTFSMRKLLSYNTIHRSREYHIFPLFSFRHWVYWYRKLQVLQYISMHICSSMTHYIHWDLLSSKWAQSCTINWSTNQLNQSIHSKNCRAPSIDRGDCGPYWGNEGRQILPISPSLCNPTTISTLLSKVLKARVELFRGISVVGKATNWFMNFGTKPSMFNNIYFKIGGGKNQELSQSNAEKVLYP